MTSNGPTIVRAISSSTEGLRAGLTTALRRLFEAREEIRVKDAIIAGQAEAIRELRAMVFRAHEDVGQ